MIGLNAAEEAAPGVRAVGKREFANHLNHDRVIAQRIERFGAKVIAAGHGLLARCQADALRGEVEDAGLDGGADAGDVVGQRRGGADEFGPTFETQLGSALPLDRRGRRLFLGRRPGAPG